jgi:hypothetical protein
MFHTRSAYVLFGVFLMTCLSIDQAAAGNGPVSHQPSTIPECLEQLASLPWCELERLYRQAEPGTIPEGFARGRVRYCPEKRFAGARARVAGALWRGKHFCADDATLINQWLGIKAIRARVGYGPSWLDGKTSIILDYQGESRVWSDVRDEMRQVAPGLYLGAMYLRRCPEPSLKLFFCLEAQCCPAPR